jgi:hypothetical protein
MKDPKIIQELMVIPGVGKSIAADLVHIGIYQVADLVGCNPQTLYDKSNEYAGCRQDLCLLYVFRTAVYFAETPPQVRDTELLKWWNWKNRKLPCELG